jgi:quinol monooxygenase YgiN
LGNNARSQLSREILPPPSLENWRSKADLDAHLASPLIDAFRAKAPDLLAEPPDITLWYEIAGG